MFLFECYFARSFIYRFSYIECYFASIFIGFLIYCGNSLTTFHSSPSIFLREKGGEKGEKTCSETLRSEHSTNAGRPAAAKDRIAGSALSHEERRRCFPGSAGIAFGIGG